MKYSKIALATSMACAAMSAHALDTGIPASPANIIYISGASGVDTYVSNIAKSFLLTGEGSYRHVYNSTSGDNAWYGKTSQAFSGVASGQQLLIIKRSAGGSAYGVIPLALGSKIDTINWSDSNATYTTSTSTVDFNVGLKTGSAGLVPDMGLSDVEPNMFVGINTENGFTALTVAQQANLTTASWGQLAEGIVVTRAVPETAKLTDNWIRGALTNSAGYTDWSKADGSAKFANGGDPVVVCRRIEGSGTQAAYNSYFSGFPNTSAFNGYSKVTPAVTSASIGKAFGNHAGTSADPLPIDPSAGYTVFEGDGSGEVRKCLQAAQMGIDVTLKGRAGLYYKLQFSNWGGPMKAIGILSMDSYTKATKSSAHVTTAADGNGYAKSVSDTNGEWTFRNLHGAGVYDVAGQTPTCSVTASTWTNTACSTDFGIAPSRANILNSSYDFTVEPTMQYRTNSSAFVVDFFNKFIYKLGNPADMNSNNSVSSNSTPFAYAAIPGLGYTKSATAYTNAASETDAQLISDLTRQGVTSAPLHVYR